MCECWSNRWKVYICIMAGHQSCGHDATSVISSGSAASVVIAILHSSVVAVSVALVHCNTVWD